MTIAGGAGGSVSAKTNTYRRHARVGRHAAALPEPLGHVEEFPECERVFEGRNLTVVNFVLMIIG